MMREPSGGDPKRTNKLLLLRCSYYGSKVRLGCELKGWPKRLRESSASGKRHRARDEPNLRKAPFDQMCKMPFGKNAVQSNPFRSLIKDVRTRINTSSGALFCRTVVFPLQ